MRESFPIGWPLVGGWGGSGSRARGWRGRRVSGGLVKTIGQIAREAIVVPTLVLGGTDSRHYEGVSENVYRFLPHRMTEADLQRVHGVNERIAVENYVEIIRFYALLMVNSDE